MKLNIAEIKKRFQPQTALAVTLKSDRIAVDLVRRETEVLRVSQSLVVPVGADLILKDPEKAGKEFAAALETAGIKERRCVVCVPPNWALSASTEVPEVSEEDLRGYLELQAEHEFPIPASELRLAHCVYALPDGKQRATLAAIPSKRLESLSKVLETAGCRAVSVSLGLERCLGDSRAALHLLADGDHVDVVIAAGGGIAALRTLADMSPTDDATFDAARFGREVRITLGRLPESVRKQVRQAHFEGSRVRAQTLCRKLREQFERMGIQSPDCDSEAVGDREVEAAGVAVEAAKSHLRAKLLPFEFVVPEANRWAAMFNEYNTKRYRTIVGAALVLIFAPIAAFIWHSHKESSLSAQWTGMRNEVDELDALQQKIRQFHPWFDATPQSLQIFDGLIASFPEQGDVWAKGFQIGDDGKITCTGFARNEAALLSLLDRLRARKDVTNLQRGPTRGNNPIQFSFTYKWEASHEG